MNIHDINFSSELPEYKIADEKDTFFANRPSKEINIEPNKLNAEQVLGNPCISYEKFNLLIDNDGYRSDCFYNILHFIHTYKARPSEEDLTLFLLGTTGGLLAEFLYEQGVVDYSREKYGYALTFRNSKIATDYFIMELIECISRLGFACQALALDYM
ncbi:hypothetical protein [Paenibacillus typhae]|uniref:hypothetical protein n=1 Tax=Paenibacillus typhae TaxID=1174501 RepID=UPI001C8D7D0A|nr:hypothetical protein [Paenibacillus typhae]MBY0013286.1 hypothetical protein [Paenibacillus typhae]